MKNKFDQSVTREDIEWAYETFLNRIPCPQERDGHLGHKNVTALVEAFISCNEFTSSRVQRHEGSIYISEYKYSPSPRPSLGNSFLNDYINYSVQRSEKMIFDILDGMVNLYDKLHAIEFNNDGTTEFPCWQQGWISPLDAISIYYFLAEKNPRYYVECGSGNTTKFAAQSIRDNGLRTKIISIDPSPRAEINSLCHKIYRIPLEEMDISFFHELTHEDIFLLDNSHRSFTNSDVTVFFTEILPILGDGLLYALHDIFLPYDYPEEWNDRFYNEQYLLASYIIGGAMGDSIIFPVCFLSGVPKFAERLKPLWADQSPLASSGVGGGFFWMARKQGSFE